MAGAPPRRVGGDSPGTLATDRSRAVVRARTGALAQVALEHPDAPPETEAIFFASPSAVHAFETGGGRLPRHVIAIGATTLDALAEEGGHAAALSEPTPAAFRTCLERLRTAN